MNKTKQIKHHLEKIEKLEQTLTVLRSQMSCISMSYKKPGGV